MRQLIQNLGSGDTVLAEVPTPQAQPGCFLIQTRRSLVSLGTERMLVEFGKANLLEKARQQPDKVKQVLDKVCTDGLLPTLEAVRHKLDQPLPLGYCNVGVILQCGMGNGTIQPGDRVVSNGPHAEVVSVPHHMCAKIPEGVSDEEAAFTVLGSVALQGIRLANPTLGERFVVYGLGLIGLLAVQLLRANGCEVAGVDINPQRLALAEQFGAVPVNAGEGCDPVSAVRMWTNGVGADGVLITASAKTDDIIHLAAEMCRKRARIILVGVVGLNLRRVDFYEKELTFQVSCSYGPGRYDPEYEQKGHDYPVGYVRWTMQRNFEAVLEMLASGRLCVDELITHRFPLETAIEAYATIAKNSSALGVILQYPAEVSRETCLQLVRDPVTAPARQVVAGVIGAGNFSKMTLLPALAETPARIKYVCDLDGVSAAHLGRKFRAENAVTDSMAVLSDTEVNAVFIAVNHNLHARFVCEGLKVGKHVLVEKPLCLSETELSEITSVYASLIARHSSPLLMVGFNRRFSPHTARMVELLAGRSEPLCLNMTVNAGAIPAGHWVHDPERGGGRIIGEACHFIDLMVHLTGSLVKTVSAVMMGTNVPVQEDKMSIALGFEDGSVGTVNYFANGGKSYPKEMLEVFNQGRVLQLENFRRLTGYGFKGFSRYRTWRQDKGHAAEFAAFIQRIAEGGKPLIALEQLVNVTLASFAAMTAARERRTVVLSEEYAGIFKHS